MMGRRRMRRGGSRYRWDGSMRFVGVGFDRWKEEVYIEYGSALKRIDLLISRMKSFAHSQRPSSGISRVERGLLTLALGQA